MTANWVRKLLALFLDYRFFVVLYEPLRFLIGRSAELEVPPWVGWVIFAAARGLLVESIQTSPGRWCLGILPGPHFPVDLWIAARERRWTVPAGIILMSEGSKGLIAWTRDLPPPPYLGDDAPAWVLHALVAAAGLLNLSAGARVLRTHALGAWIGAAVAGVEAMATLGHTAEMERWGARMSTLQRELRELPPPSPEQLEQAQQSAALYAPIMLLLLVLYFLFVGRTLRRA